GHGLCDSSAEKSFCRPAPETRTRSMVRSTRPIRPWRMPLPCWAIRQATSTPTARSVASISSEAGLSRWKASRPPSMSIERSRQPANAERSRSGSSRGALGGAARDLGGDGGGERVGRFLAPEVAGSHPLAQEVEGGGFDHVSQVGLAELVEEHGEREEDGG